MSTRTIERPSRPITVWRPVPLRSEAGTTGDAEAPARARFSHHALELAAGVEDVIRLTHHVLDEGAPIGPHHELYRGAELARTVAGATEVVQVLARRVDYNDARGGPHPRTVHQVEVAHLIEAYVPDGGELLPIGFRRGGPDAVHQLEIR
ncbi:hypothetical protein [Candidatus Palauibacter sp.]|uniref:hypothetical protein n=1 Tax=Candidatus Palauibacter sp. TaxID=3101350 RepID=UPI003AF238F5